MDQLRQEGVAPEHLRAAAAELVGQAISESTLTPNLPHDGGTGYGIYGARLERRDAMFAWLASHGFSKNSLEGQMRFMAHEAMTNPRFARTREILRGATEGNIIGRTGDVTTNFEGPGPASWPKGPFNDRRPNVGKAYRAGEEAKPAPVGRDKSSSLYSPRHLALSSLAAKQPVMTSSRSNSLHVGKIEVSAGKGANADTIAAGITDALQRSTMAWLANSGQA